MMWKRSSFKVPNNATNNQEEDELEFSVCLPSPTLEPSALLTNNHTEPVVFILGWEVIPISMSSE